MGILFFVGGPLFVQYNYWPSGSSGNGDWLGFWGSYLGIIPSGLIAFAVASFQISNEQKRFKEQLNQTKYVENLMEISGKIRELDSVFEYGYSYQYLFKTRSEAKTFYNGLDGEELENMMKNLTNYMYEEKVFNRLATLLLDIEMMPRVRESEIYKSIYELRDKIIDLSNWFVHINSERVPVGEGENAYISLVDKYKSCNEQHRKVLKQIADEAYAI